MARHEAPNGLYAEQQIYAKDKEGSLKPIGPDNPLVIALAEALKLVGIDIQGVSLINPDEFLNVKIVGGSAGGGVTETDAVEIIDIVTASSLRNTTAVTVPLPDVKKYKKYIIQVFNGLDQDVKVVPWNTAPVVLEDESFGFLATASADPLAYSWVVPKKNSNNNSLFFLNAITPKSNGGGTLKIKNPAMLFETYFNNPGTLMQLAYKADTAPTTGTITIRIIGFKR